MTHIINPQTESNIAAVQPPKEKEAVADERREAEARAWQKRYATVNQAHRTQDRTAQDAMLRVQSDTGLLAGTQGIMPAGPRAADLAPANGSDSGEPSTKAVHASPEQDDPAPACNLVDTVSRPDRQINAAGQDGLDDISIATDELASMAASDGIFELIFPSGETVGVAVATQDARTSLLLKPSTGELGSRLQERRIDMTSRLERRMQRTVSITVL